MTRVTVFTPTYNRAATLPRLFESLLRQGTLEFEWLIVDDGSTDHTGSLVNAWIEKAPFSVRYIRQQNGGKHAAANTGVRVAEGELFWTVDSDDWLPDGVLARMLSIWDDITQGGQRREIVALTGLCIDTSGVVIGDRFPSSPLESNSLEVSLVHRIRGDKAGWTRTSVLRCYPFPEGPYNFVPEGIVWNAIALEFQTTYVNEPFLIKEYQEDGFTLGGARVNALGMAMYHQSLLNDATLYLRRNPRALLRSVASYSRFSLSADVTWRTLLADLDSRRMRMLVVVLGPVGWWLRRGDRRSRPE